MAGLEIIGFDISNWVRAARIACEEKGVAYELTTNGMTGFADMKSEKHLALHPFGRIPAMRHATSFCSRRRPSAATSTACSMARTSCLKTRSRPRAWSNG